MDISMQNIKLQNLLLVFVAMLFCDTQMLACIDPNLKLISKDVSVKLCSGKNAKGLLDLTKLKPENIRQGVSVAGVAGTLQVAPNSCVQGGQANCLLKGNYKAADKAAAINTNIRSGIAIAGVTGNVTPAPATCSTNGQTGCVSSNTFPAAANIAAGNIKNGVTLGGVTGTYGPVQGEVIDPWNIRAGVAVGDTIGALKVDCRSGTNSGGVFLPDNHAPATFPSGWEDHVCDGSNWEDVSRTSAGVASTCSQGDCIYRDRVSNSMWTKTQPAAVWGDALQECEDLVWGGYTDWRFPTQKEAISAHVNGMARIGNSGFFSPFNMPTATTFASGLTTYMLVDMATGSTYNTAKTDSKQYLCVRP